MGDFAAGSLLIAFGAILGKVNLFQLWVLGSIFMIFYALNESIGLVIFLASDIGGSMTIHTFGAYFGLAASFFYQNKEAIKDKNKLCGSSYTSNLVAMVGTLFLFTYWPSFNAALGVYGTQRYRVILNTVFSLTTSVMSACLFCRVAKGKLDMEIVLNATLAGGVALGAAADLINQTFSAMLVGFCAGAISALGFAYVGPYLKEKIGLHDTCGVHNLHGMPGIVGACVSAIVSASSKRNFGDRYNQHLGNPRAFDRTPSEQAGF